MNYEKFNDAICRLRQAEEDFNKALQDAHSAIDKAYLNDSSTELQAQIDEAYNKGLKDMHEAIQLIATDGSDGGMSIFELKDAFGMASVCDIILGYSPQEIMDKTLAWTTKRKESQELHVGDEILVINSNPKLDNRTFVIYEIDDHCYYVIEPITFHKDGFYKNAYIKNQIMKTGKHYDSIPLSKEIK